MGAIEVSARELKKWLSEIISSASTDHRMGAYNCVAIQFMPPLPDKSPQTSGDEFGSRIVALATNRYCACRMIFPCNGIEQRGTVYCAVDDIKRLIRWLPSSMNSEVAISPLYNPVDDTMCLWCQSKYGTLSTTPMELSYPDIADVFVKLDEMIDKMAAEVEPEPSVAFTPGELGHVISMCGPVRGGILLYLPEKRPADKPVIFRDRYAPNTKIIALMPQYINLDKESAKWAR